MNISNIEQYVQQINDWNRLFNPSRETLSLLNPEHRQRIADRLDGDLSPENLTCDGELPPAQVRTKHAYLTRCARELMNIDPCVTFYEFN